ncbi:MAG: signal peptidase I [Candidatus Ratteibacteria bacterium]|nr:signal peptidase I [Candidatus Ratteibacteria bacterium]
MEKKNKKQNKTAEWFKSLIWAVIIALLIRAFLIGNFKIPSTSMVPTLKVGDRLLSNDVIYKIRPPKRGEVVIFKYPEDPKRDFVKRMIGLPGEKVMIKDGMIFINGKVVEEESISRRYYYSEGFYGNGEEVEVPPDSYYVLGDNSINSRDSRYWGFVPKKNLVGKALFTYWPPWRMGFIH